MIDIDSGTPCVAWAYSEWIPRRSCARRVFAARARYEPDRGKRERQEQRADIFRSGGEAGIGTDEERAQRRREWGMGTITTAEVFAGLRYAEGFRWPSGSLTYSIPVTGSFWSPSSYGHGEEPYDAAYGVMSAAQRPAVMHFAGVAHDDVAGVGIDMAAPAGRTLRAVFDQPHAVHRMPVAAEVARAFNVGGVHAGPGRAEDAALVDG